MAAGSAVAGGLLLVSLGIGRTPARPVPTSGGLVVSEYYDPRFSPLVTSAEIRVGVLTGVLLLVAAAVGLLVQAVCAGGVRRRDTARALHVAGAAPGQLRTVQALQVGRAGAAGGLLAGPVYLVLWSVLGPAVDPVVRLLPDLGWADLVGWAAVAIGCAAGGAAIGALTGAVAGRPARRVRGDAVAIGLVVVLLGAVAAVPVAGSWDRRAGVAALGVVVAVLLGAAVVAGAGWTRVRAARLRRSGSADAVLTAAGLSAAAGPIGTASAVSLVAGVVVGVCAPLALVASPDRFAGDVPGLALAGTAALLGLLVALATATLGAVDDLATHRRSLAATAALGVELRVLRRVQGRRLRLATVGPVATGTVLGTVIGTGVTGADAAIGVVAGAGCAVVVVGVVWTATLVIGWSLHGRLADAVDPGALRAA
ncbi:hypothetical protein TEK04_12805 [Klenkia sp. LSe6-5]|uniref:FtsX-like permease family protein n=1 Tax=Klenkia sesuvii TaxID=3103137 RepID=A0ABU8DVB0_9ACTN